MEATIASRQLHWAKKNIKLLLKTTHPQMLNGMRSVNCKFYFYASLIRLKNLFKNLFLHEHHLSAIPTQGNRAELTLTCLHHNGFGLDEVCIKWKCELNTLFLIKTSRTISFI
jgi:hypothetical protein